MKIGVPKEIKDNEYRVGLIPLSISKLVKLGHEVFVESNAGEGIGFSDDDYQNAGAIVVSSSDEVFKSGELIIKVKEPQPIECEKLTTKHILFTFLHLAPDPIQADLLIKSRCAAIAYETVTDISGRLPLLSPMSAVAGRVAVQAGAHYLEKSNGGRGILLGGVEGVSPGKVVILGGGIVGSNALLIAIGLGADVVVIDKSEERLKQIQSEYGNKVKTSISSADKIQEEISQADLVIGAVLLAGAKAPRLITKDMLQHMKKGSVIVDVAIDQGGCVETSKPTTFSSPIFNVDGVIHYCVTNMPGSVPLTSTFALNNAVLPFVIEVANKGLKRACLDDKNLLNGLNVYQGAITSESVATSLGLKYVNPLSLMK